MSPYPHSRIRHRRTPRLDRHSIRRPRQRTLRQRQKVGALQRPQRRHNNALGAQTVPHDPPNDRSGQHTPRKRPPSIRLALGTLQYLFRGTQPRPSHQSALRKAPHPHIDGLVAVRPRLLQGQVANARRQHADQRTQQIQQRDHLHGEDGPGPLDDHGDEECKTGSGRTDADAEGGDGLDAFGLGEETFGFGRALDGVCGDFFAVGDGDAAYVFGSDGDGGADFLEMKVFIFEKCFFSFGNRCHVNDYSGSR